LFFFSGEIFDDSERKSRKKKKKQKSTSDKEQSDNLSKQARRDEKIVSLSNSIIEDWKELKVWFYSVSTVILIYGKRFIFD